MIVPKPTPPGLNKKRTELERAQNFARDSLNRFQQTANAYTNRAQSLQDRKANNNMITS